MSKSPAFQFYASDFLVDTAEMTNQEVGVYIRLLSHQWVNGNLNGDPNRLANVVGIDLLDVWPEIEHKFELSEDGKLRNPKLEKVRQVQIDYRSKQSEAGKRGAAKRWDSTPNSNPNGEKIALQSSSSSSKDQDQTLTSSPKVNDPVPFQDIVNLYHEKLPELPKCEILNAKRKGYIRQRWQDKEHGLHTLEHWSNFFTHIRKSDFLMGKAQSNNGRQPFRANLEWLTNLNNYTKVYEDKYHGK